MTNQHYDLNKIANDVVGEVWSDVRLYVPVYRFDIKTEEEANSKDGLPLMYIWNEKIKDGVLTGFSFSINGSIIGSMLEKFLPRSHSEFIRVRDLIIGGIQSSQNKVVMDNCMKARKRPSDLYGSY